MTIRPVRRPSADHPITVAPHRGRVVVAAGGKVVADTRRALDLQEADYRVVRYIPREDVDMTLFERSTHVTYCPYKGEATHFSIPAAGERSVNAAWSYEAPHPFMREIEGYIAFYADRVDRIEVEAERAGYFRHPGLAPGPAPRA
jgi:uncharacterized protein (DUF427 family)